jgi:predicted O-methyltransferase YrrM
LSHGAARDGATGRFFLVGDSNMSDTGVKQFLKNIAPKWARDMNQRRGLARQAKQLVATCPANPTMEQVFDHVFKFPTFAPLQKRPEFLALLNATQKLGAKTIGEIGGFCGGSLFMFCRAAQPGARLLSMDLDFTPDRATAYSSFGVNGQQVTCIQADSHIQPTADRVADWLKGEKFDVLFIDGDHSYEGVVKDFQMYAPFVRPGGIIGFHDVQQDYNMRYGRKTENDVGGVPIFWDFLKKNYKTEQHVENPEQDGYGIGILQWDGTLRMP